MLAGSAAAEHVEEHARIFFEEYMRLGFTFLEKSKLYPCRPPHQNDTRFICRFYRRRYNWCTSWRMND